ncbi:hypothetical protein B0T38_09160 [Chromobacterium violaceum]|nr:hypothetical protein B0T38_09160 [Chromobacterium violaceum]
MRMMKKTLCLLAALAAQGAAARDVPAALAGHYVLDEYHWSPASLSLDANGKFDWRLLYSGDFRVRGTWGVEDGKVMLHADPASEKAVYQPIQPASCGISPSQHRGLTLAVFVSANDRCGWVGVEGNEVVFEDDKGHRQPAEKSRQEGFSGATMPADWGQWRRVGLRREGSRQPWQWFAVSDASRAANMMVVKLVNINEVAPAYRDVELTVGREDGEVSLPRPKLPISLQASSSMTYRKIKPLNEKQAIGRYESADRSIPGDLELGRNHRARWSLAAGKSMYVEGKWRLDGNYVRIVPQLPSEKPSYRAMSADEYKIKSAATEDELIAIVGMPRVGGAQNIEAKFEVDGKVVGSAVSNDSGDAILKWSGKAEKWTRVALRRAGSRDPWVWLTVPEERRANRIMGVAISDLSLAQPAFSELVLLPSADGGLKMKDPTMDSTLEYRRAAPAQPK